MYLRDGGNHRFIGNLNGFLRGIVGGVYRRQLIGVLADDCGQ
uniref:Uncharacterized protein n=1 Tax=Yoonia rhodophyticola TaxID=3137370 RepID=A0AAN0MDV3_9RHOB